MAHLALAPAGGAGVGDDSAAAAALRARLIGLHGHAHEILLGAHGAGAVAVRTGLGARALLCAASMAGAARFDAGEGDLAFTAESRVLKADLDLADDVLALRRTSSAAGRRRAAAEEIAEDIAEIPEAAEAAASKSAEARVRIEIRVDAREAVLVVPGLFIGVGQNLIRLVDLLELFLGGLVAGVLIGVVFHGQLAVGLFDLGVGRVFLDAQHLVIISFVLICHTISPQIRWVTADRGGHAAPVKLCFTN